MNQRTIFSVIGVVLVLQGIFFYFMADYVVTDAFAGIDEAAKSAPMVLMQVMGVMSITLGVIAFATRNTAEVLIGFLIGFVLFLMVSLKHLFVDHINVPIPAIVVQAGVVFACIYLRMQWGKAKAA